MAEELDNGFPESEDVCPVKANKKCFEAVQSHEAQSTSMGLTYASCKYVHLVAYLVGGTPG
jgi:hypothetical protein